MYYEYVYRRHYIWANDSETTKPPIGHPLHHGDLVRESPKIPQITVSCRWKICTMNMYIGDITL